MATAKAVPVNYDISIRLFNNDAVAQQKTKRSDGIQRTSVDGSAEVGLIMMGEEFNEFNHLVMIRACLSIRKGVLCTIYHV